MSGYGRWLVGLAFMGLLSIGPARNAHAASFDCTKAAETIELLICGDPRLSALDERLEGAFRAARDRLPPVGQSRLIGDERRWLQTRDTSCIAGRVIDASRAASEGARQCLSLLTDQRIRTLTGQSAPVPSTPAQGAADIRPPSLAACPSAGSLCFWQALTERQKAIFVAGIVQGATAASWANDAGSAEVNRTVQMTFRHGSPCEAGMTPLVLRGMMEEKLEQLPAAIGIHGQAFRAFPVFYWIGLTLKEGCE